MSKVKVHIVTPDRLFFDEEVDSFTFFSTEGYLEVFYDHIPTTTALKSGIAIFRSKDEKPREAVLHGGFAEVTETSVNVITDAAEWAEEIDLDRAKAAKKRAMDEMASLEATDEKIIAKEAALERAIRRIELAEKHK